MTPDQWATATDPTPMLSFLRTSGKASDRKLRLFACACCRRAFHAWLADDISPAVRACESFSDGVIDWSEIQRVRADIGGVGSYSAKASVYSAMSAALSDNPLAAAEEAAKHSAACFGFTRIDDWFTDDNRADFLAAIDQEYQVQADLLRDIFGNPFREARLDPSLLTDRVVSSARETYEERILPQGHLDPERLAVLAEEVERAGPSATPLVEHLREPGAVHVRGCWAVDLLLG